jgi:hypothetical protein
MAKPLCYKQSSRACRKAAIAGDKCFCVVKVSKRNDTTHDGTNTPHRCGACKQKFTD